MDGPEILLRRLAACLSSGDLDAAAALFSPQAHITLHDGEQVSVTVGPGTALAAAVTAFSDIDYIPVLRSLGDGVADDGVLTGVHRSLFWGCPPTGRRVYLNVHLGARAADDGLLAELTLTTSQASLRHQLAGGGDVHAVADGLTAEVRYRTRSPEPAVAKGLQPVDATRGAGVITADTVVSDVVHPGRHERRRSPARPWVAALLLTLLLAAVTGGVLLALHGDHSSPTAPSVLSAPETVPTTHAADTSTGSPPTATTAAAGAPPSPTSAGTAVIVLPTGQPQVQPGRQVVLPSDVLFGIDSAQLSPETHSALSDLAQQIRAAHVTGQIQVNGYTDNLGSPAHGLELSRQRALAVAQALQAALGDSPVTLLPQGFGDADPIADNGTEQGRARNRRVTIVLPTTT